MAPTRKIMNSFRVLRPRILQKTNPPTLGRYGCFWKQGKFQSWKNMQYMYFIRIKWRNWCWRTWDLFGEIRYSGKGFWFLCYFSKSKYRKNKYWLCLYTLQSLQITINNPQWNFVFGKYWLKTMYFFSIWR